jgi:hypothetical protein
MCVVLIEAASLLQEGGSWVRNLGHPAYSRPKGTGDHSMPEKREMDEVSESVVPRDPHGKAKAGLLEVHS